MCRATIQCPPIGALDMSRFMIALSFCLFAQAGIAQQATVDSQINETKATSSTSTVSTPLMNPRPGLYTSGQPSINEWKSLRKRGITTVVNLRPMNEMGGRDEAKEVRAEGMTYIEVPIFTAQDINDVNAKKLKAALNAANGKPVLVHCASGNRVGGLLALMAVQEEHMPVEQAIELGKAAGMKSTETRVRQVFAAPAPKDSPTHATMSAPASVPAPAPAPPAPPAK